MLNIIVNPASQSGKGIRIWKETVKPALEEAKVEYKAYFSDKAGDVEILTRHILENYQGHEKDCFIIILGGDGTVNETLQGIAYPTDAHIGYIPTGSSNDLARDIRMKTNPTDALAELLAAVKSPDNHTRKMDRGVVKSGDYERSFAVSCGIGFDAAVCEEAMHSKFKNLLNKLHLGKLTYLGIALKQLLGTKPVSCDIYLDDAATPIHVDRIVFAAVMNHRYEGGGFKFCPKANASDGIFDLCVVGNISKPMILMALPTAFKGKHYRFKGIEQYMARKVRIVTSQSLWFHTDGEVHDRTRDMTLECKKGEIPFLL